MAQGQFTKEEADETSVAVKELFEALPRTKRIDYVGHLNDIYLFIEAAKLAAPAQATPPVK